MLFTLFTQLLHSQVTCVQLLYVSLDANGQYTVFPEELVAAGDISQYTAIALPSSFSCEDLGQGTITLYLYEGNDLAYTCTSTIIVEDKISPIVICKASPHVVLDGNGEHVITMEDIEHDSYDNCGITNFQVVPSVITCGSSNPLEVTGYFSDASGNTASCTTLITWEENPNNALVPACNDEVTVEILPGQTLTVTPEMILEGGPYGCYSNYFPVLNVNGTDLPEPVLTQADTNSTIIAMIVDISTGSACWGEMNVVAPTPCTDPFYICDTACRAAPDGDCNSGHTSADHVEWPCDLYLTLECGQHFTHITPAFLEALQTIDVEDIYPQLINEGCNLTDVVYEDNVFLLQDGKRIERTWTVINWTSFESWTYPQTIHVSYAGGNICDFLPHTAPAGDCDSGHTLNDNVEWPADITVNTVFISPDDLAQNPNVAAEDAAPQLFDECDQYLLTKTDSYTQINDTTLQVERTWQIFNTTTQQIYLYTQTITITGYTGQSQVCVTRESGEPIPGVELMPGIMTGSNGCLSFPDPAGQHVTPIKDAPLAEGINVLDQILMLEHILGISELSRFKVKAADLSQNGLVSTLDYFGLEQIIAGEFVPTFDHNWMFFDQNTMASAMDISNPMVPYHFVGVKMGDLDDSYIIQGAPSFAPISMIIHDEILNKKEEYQIPFFIEESNRLVGFSVKINNPSGQIDFREITAPLLLGFSMENNVTIESDYILIQWIAPDDYVSTGIPVSRNDALFTIRLSPAVNSILSEELILDNTYDNLLKPNGDREALEIKMNWEDLIISSTVNLGHDRQIEIYPNPVSDVLFVKGIIDNEPGQLSIYDPAGRLMLSSPMRSSIELGNLQTGIYYLLLQNAEGNTAAVPLYKK